MVNVQGGSMRAMPAEFLDVGDDFALAVILSDLLQHVSLG
jgi:hypothetical protein